MDNVHNVMKNDKDEETYADVGVREVVFEKVMFC